MILTLQPLRFGRHIFNVIPLVSPVVRAGATLSGCPTISASRGRCCWGGSGGGGGNVDVDNESELDLDVDDELESDMDVDGVNVDDELKLDMVVDVDDKLRLDMAMAVAPIGSDSGEVDVAGSVDIRVVAVVLDGPRGCFEDKFVSMQVTI